MWPLTQRRGCLPNCWLRSSRRASAIPDDDIAYWKQERAKLQTQLDALETEAVQKASLPLIRYLKTRIMDLDRHIANLETRRNS